MRLRSSRAARVRTVRRARPIALAAAVLAASFTPAGPAHAESESFYYTYNRPSIIEAGGASWMAWADTSSAGSVHVVDFRQSEPANDTASVVSEWTDYTPTYYGTGPTIENSHGNFVVAFTDTNRAIDLVEPYDGKFACYSYFGPTGDTPYLTSEGKDGTGNLYLTWVNAADNTLFVGKVTVPDNNECAYSGSFGLQVVAHISTDTSFGGPALVVSGYGTSAERFWLIWSGTGGTHYINVAEYNTDWTRIAKYTEYDHATSADIGGAYDDSNGEVYLAYCGTDGRPYYQYFPGRDGGFAENQAVANGTCTVTPYSTAKNTYYSGGVGVHYDYSDNQMILTWPDNKNVEFQAL